MSSYTEITSAPRATARPADPSELLPLRVEAAIIGGRARVTMPDGSRVYREPSGVRHVRSCGRLMPRIGPVVLSVLEAAEEALARDGLTVADYVVEWTHE